MKFLCLVYLEEGTLAALSPSEMVSLDRDSLAYDKELSRSGHYLVSDALAHVRTARTVRVRRGKATTIDGPFAETKEHLGGFILINAANMDEAVDIRRKDSDGPTRQHRSAPGDGNRRRVVSRARAASGLTSRCLLVAQRIDHQRIGGCDRRGQREPFAERIRQCLRARGAV